MIESIMVDKNELTRLKLDLKRRFLKYSNRSALWKIYYYFSNIQYRTLLFYRLSKIFKKNVLLKLFFSFLYRTTAVKSGLEILCPVGGGVIIPHFGPIKLNAESIGNNLYVFHNVTLGNDYRTGKPTLGNNVFVGTHSVILGKITIGNNVVIGASSLVNRDIPDNYLVVGNPVKLIKKINPKYISDLTGS